MEIAGKAESFAVGLLDLCRGSEEVWLLFKQDHDPKIGVPTNFEYPRMHLAFRYEMKEVCICRVYLWCHKVIHKMIAKYIKCTPSKSSSILLPVCDTQELPAGLAEPLVGVPSECHDDDTLSDYHVLSATDPCLTSNLPGLLLCTLPGEVEVPGCTHEQVCRGRGLLFPLPDFPAGCNAQWIRKPRPACTETKPCGLVDLDLDCELCLGPHQDCLLQRLHGFVCKQSHCLWRPDEHLLQHLLCGKAGISDNKQSGRRWIQIWAEDLLALEWSCPDIWSLLLPGNALCLCTPPAALSGTCGGFLDDLWMSLFLLCLIIQKAHHSSQEGLSAYYFLADWSGPRAPAAVLRSYDGRRHSNDGYHLCLPLCKHDVTDKTVQLLWGDGENRCRWRAGGATWCLCHVCNHGDTCTDKTYGQYEGLYHLYRTYDNVTCAFQISSHDSLDLAFKSLFWNIFGYGDPAYAAVVVDNTCPNDDETACYNATYHDFTEGTGYFVYGTYQLIMLTVLMNMMIALMSDTFAKIQVPALSLHNSVLNMVAHIMQLPFLPSLPCPCSPFASFALPFFPFLCVFASFILSPILPHCLLPYHQSILPFLSDLVDVCSFFSISNIPSVPLYLPFLCSFSLPHLALSFPHFLHLQLHFFSPLFLHRKMQTWSGSLPGPQSGTITLRRRLAFPIRSPSSQMCRTSWTSLSGSQSKCENPRAKQQSFLDRCCKAPIKGTPTIPPEHTHGSMGYWKVHLIEYVYIPSPYGCMSQVILTGALWGAKTSLPNPRV